jgi:hypothetical protein
MFAFVYAIAQKVFSYERLWKFYESHEKFQRFQIDVYHRGRNFTGRIKSSLFRLCFNRELSDFDYAVEQYSDLE